MRLETSFGAIGVFAVLSLGHADWQRLWDSRNDGDPVEISRCSSDARLVESYKYYEFFGARAQDANQSFRQSLLVTHDFAGRQKRFAGQADWHIEWRTCLEPRGNGCRIGGVTSTVNVTYTLPRWADRDAAQGPLQSRWDRYAKSLYEHERGHGRIALQVASLIEQELVGLADLASCEQVNAEATRRVDQVMRRGEVMQNDYDKATGHGSSQGAVFPF